MATYFHEVPESRVLTMTPPTAVTHWVLEGEFDDLTVANIAIGGTPATWVHPLGVLERDDMEVKEAGFRLWNIMVHYSLTDQEIGSFVIEVDTLGGTVHVKGGVHVAVFPSGQPTHNGLIGVKGDDVEGADIVIPASRVIVHYSHPANYLTTPQIRTMTRAVGSVDNSGIFGWDPYEVLFLGFQCKQSTTLSTANLTQREEVSYHFAMSENLANFAIANITGISKKGWDVAWVKWREAVESSKASNTAEYVNVVQVYRELNLKTILGIG